VVQTIGYCDYGPIQANGDGGCFPMGTADDLANCQQWGKVVTACPILSKCGTRTETYDSDLYSCSAGDVIRLKNSVSYGGESYGAVLIGTQTWMTKNMNIDMGGNSKCPDNTASNCTTYGRQYDWATAMEMSSSCNTTSCNIGNNHRGICPTGWHIPSTAEWSTLVNFVGSNAGIKLRAATSLYVQGYQGTNDYGFSALMGGYVEYGSIYDSYYDIGSIGYWWTTTQYNANNAYNRGMSRTSNSVSRYGVESNDYSMTKRNMLSVRCIKN
jgi:uncharacterized protein (TIGR02145 family)